MLALQALAWRAPAQSVQTLRAIGPYDPINADGPALGCRATDMSTPQTRYATSEDASIAYQVVGSGPIDLVLVLGFATHLELQWESPPMAHFLERISSFSRLIVFDKRGTGLSDPVAEVPTVEQRIDDVRAVMDAARSDRAALLGISEGGPTCVLFAAVHPSRVSSLVLYGAMGRTTEAPDYPWASPADALRESAAEFIAPYWGQQAEGMVELFAPSLAHDPRAAEFTARMERSAASPAMVQKIFEMFLDIDVRAVLPTIHVPTLVLHRRSDRVVNRRAGKELANRIPGARYVELPGIDHLPWAGDSDAVLGEIEEFLTGRRSVPEPDRVLATVMFTDIVGSTERAAELGDSRWRELLASHHAAVRRELIRFRGREVKTLGDGFLATFDGPARAISCGLAVAAEARSLGIEVRVGVHTGEVELIGQDVGGIAVHIAARVGALATPGEVLASSTVKDLVAGSGIRFVDRGSRHLKGIADEWRLFAPVP
jgi:pimeloyl-ACP methyl ester carboxylesterase/class 3 adenylate cyclase